VKSDRVVVNASPLIVLFKASLAHLLPQVFTEVLVPGAVWDEVIAGGPNDMAAQGLATTDWAKRIEVAAVDPAVLAWNLGQGESEVLSVALDHSGYRAVIDDAAARRCARTLQVPILGTGGVLVLAKRRGWIPSVGSSLQELRDAGLWLSDDIVALLVQQAGE
jgi:predicted nucleic acid-binding protein